MKKLDIVIMAIMLIGAIWAAFLPNVKPHLHYLSAKELLYEINKNEHYISVDDVAKAIMTNDKFTILIDVRDPKQYQEFTLPGALNIPKDSILLPKYRYLLNSDIYRLVLFSNGTSLADMAWLIATDAGFKNLYVMQGGLNAWFTKILMPQPPKPWAKKEEFEKYQFRKAAAFYFTGGEVKETKPKQIKITVPVKKKEVGGGCE